MIAGELPFMGNSVEKVYDEIRRGNLRFTNPIWSKISKECKELIQSLLKVDPDERIKLQDAL